jgi:hypothetical protein
MKSTTQKAKLTARRTNVLSGMLGRGTDRNLDADARTWLRQRALTGGLASVRVRSGFVRADEALTDASDKKRPAVRDGWPPVSILSSIPNGVALRTAITALFLAQTRNRAIFRRGAIQLPLRAISANEPGWTDVMVVPAVFRSRQAGSGATQHTLRDNRVRQVRDALDRLDIEPKVRRRTKTPMARVGLFGSPPQAGTARRSPTPVTLYAETGLRVGEPIDWVLPQREYFEVPISFWTNGWVHALTPSEIANFLMYLHLDTTEPLSADAAGHAVNGYTRGALYGLTPDAWDTHQTLSRFGLLDVTPDPERRDDGQIPGGATQHGHLHRIRTTLAGLEQPAVETVLTALRAMEDE